MTEKYIPIIDLANALYIKQYQELETSVIKFSTLMKIDSTEGEALDFIGDQVGMKREGRDDETYRLFIKAKAIANSSEGKISDILTAIDLLSANDLGYIQEYTKAIDVYLDVDPDLAKCIKEFLQQVVEAGVKIMTVQPAVCPGCFGFEDSEDSETFGDITDQTAGGDFSYIIT